MNNYRCLAIGILCLLLLLPLAACKAVMPGRVLLSAPRSADAFTPVAAVEANGTRHFAWTEPDFAAARQAMVYARTYPDGAFYLVEWHSPTSGVNYRNPDLVVTSDGIAYLSYTGCSYGPSGDDCDAYYSAFIKDWHGMPSLPIPAGIGPNNLVLVQRANWVYMLGATPDPIDPNTSSIYYKRLAGGSRQGLVAREDDHWAVTPSGAIDAAGNLHVAFRSYSYLGANRIGYANNVGSTGDMGAPVYQPVSGGFPTPAISRAEVNGDIFVACAVQGAPSDELFVWRPYPLPATAPVSLSLGPAANWHILESPALAALGTGNYVVIFSASNADTDGTEIWTYEKNDSAPTRITNDTVNDGPPLVAKAVFELPVYAWRTWSSGAPGHTCYGDVKVVTNAMNPNVYTAFHNKGTCDNAGFDLAVSEGEGVGVWLDLRGGGSVVEPWYAADWLERFLPTIRR